MWNWGLGKCPCHGENQKHFGLALTEMMMIETPILTLRHITWFISTSALITSLRPSPFPWLPIFQQGWLICSQPPPPSACAFIFLTRVVLSNTLTQKSVGLSTALGSSNIHFPSLLSAAGRLWKTLCSLCHFFEPNAFTYCQMHANLTCPTPQNPEVISPPDLPRHTGSPMLSCS